MSRTPVAKNPGPTPPSTSSEGMTGPSKPTPSSFSEGTWRTHWFQHRVNDTFGLQNTKKSWPSDRDTNGDKGPWPPEAAIRNQTSSDPLNAPGLTHSQTLHGTGIHVYIDPPNHPNVGIYMAYMECLGLTFSSIKSPYGTLSLKSVHQHWW